MRLVPLALLLLLPAATLRSEVIALELTRTPFCLVGATVKVSVGKAMSMVEGQYEFKYVPRFDQKSLDRLAFEFAVFVPKETDSFEALTEITQMKLRVEGAVFEPTDHEFLTDTAGPPAQILPEEMRVAIVTFRIPRKFLRQRVSLSVSYFQPHYRFAGRDVSAFFPLLPDFEALKNEFLFSRSDFTVEFEAVDAVRLQRLSVNKAVAQETPTAVQVHPVHGESIAIAVEGSTRP